MNKSCTQFQTKSVIFISEHRRKQLTLMESTYKSTQGTLSSIQSGLQFKDKNNHKGDTFSVYVASYRIQEQLQLYHWRKQHKDSLISVQWTRIEPLDDEKVIIYLQCRKKLVPLPQLKTIQKQSLNCISKILQSFDLLYSKFGPFELSPLMVTFDPSYEPYVWMNNNYFLNQYQRDHISQQNFAENVLGLLLRNKEKFQDIEGFEEQLCVVRNCGLKLQEMVFCLKTAAQKVQSQRSMSQQWSEQEYSQDQMLSFRPNKIRKRSGNTTRKDSSSSAACVCYPPTNLTIKASETSQKTKESHNIFLEFREQSKSSSLLPLVSQFKQFKDGSNTRRQSEGALEGETGQFLKHYKGNSSHVHTNSQQSPEQEPAKDQPSQHEQRRLTRLCVSLQYDSENEDQERRDSPVRVPILDRYTRSVVESVINPSTEQ